MNRCTLLGTSCVSNNSLYASSARLKLPKWNAQYPIHNNKSFVSPSRHFNLNSNNANAP
jgi:hypothetical protein